MSGPSTGSGRGFSTGSARERAVAFAGLLFGGGLGLVTAAQPWWRASAQGAEVAFTGTASTGGLAQALAVVVLVGALLAATLRARGRQVLAGLLLAAAAGMVVVGGLRLRPGAAAVRSGLRQVTLSEQCILATTAWPWIFAFAGLAAATGAAVLLARARAWPKRPDRFRRAPAATTSADPAAVWAALDAGADPTEVPPDSTGPADPHWSSRREP